MSNEDIELAIKQIKQLIADKRLKICPKPTQLQVPIDILKNEIERALGGKIELVKSDGRFNYWRCIK